MIIIDQVQGHLNDRSVALSVQATKMTARLLAKAMQNFMKRARSPTHKQTKQGKQSLKSLTKQGAKLESIPISNQDIGSFKKVARKYNIDFSLKKDKSSDPPKWLVFFKAKDGKSLASAFTEYSNSVLKERNTPSMDNELERFKKIAKELTPPTPEKPRDKEEIDI